MGIEDAHVVGLARTALGPRYLDQGELFMYRPALDARQGKDQWAPALPDQALTGGKTTEGTNAQESGRLLLAHPHRPLPVRAEAPAEVRRYRECDVAQ